MHGEESVSALEALKIAVNKRACDFTRTVGAEIEADNAVVFRDFRIVRNNRRNNKFIGNTGIIRFLNCFNCGVFFNALAVNQCGICLFNALPAVVTIHCIVPSRKSADFSDAEFFHFIFKLLNIFNSACGRNVTSVHKSVNEYLGKSAALCKLQKRKHMRYMAMYAAVGQKPVNMERTAVLFAVFNSL